MYGSAKRERVKAWSSAHAERREAPEHAGYTINMGAQATKETKTIL